MRTVVGATTAVSVAGKVLAVVLAERVVDGDIKSTTVVGALALGMHVVARLLSSGARVDVLCDLQRAMTRALIECDVLTEPTPQPLRAQFEPVHNARALVTETAPELLASLIAAAAVAPIVAATLPARVLVVSFIALVVVMAALFALGRLSGRVQEGIWAASQEVLDELSFAVEGRLEIVARGGDDDAIAGVNRAIERYRTTAKRGAWTASMLGRAPLAAGILAVVTAAVLDVSYREAVTATVLKQALVLMACLPIIIGVVLRANEIVRLSATVGPVLDVLAAPRRDEVTRKGATPPELPATIALSDVTFAYEAGAPSTLRELTFEWPKGGALFIEGPNGAGKSTLLRVLLGLRSPQKGSVTIGGADLATVDLSLLRRTIAYLPQRPYLGEVCATVRSALAHAGADGAESSDPAMTSALERVGLSGAARAGDLLEMPVGELSAGQRQRLALARVLLHDARIYLLDEPDANLDRAGIALVGDIVRDLLSRGRMVAVAAHTDDLASIPGTRLTLS